MSLVAVQTKQNGLPRAVVSSGCGSGDAETLHQHIAGSDNCCSVWQNMTFVAEMKKHVDEHVMRKQYT